MCLRRKALSALDRADRCAVGITGRCEAGALTIYAAALTLIAEASNPKW